jgi:cysteine desulfurase
MNIFRKPSKRIYLDYASATPVRKEVIKAMEPFWSRTFGNASAIHKEGVAVREAIETARRKLARLLHVKEEGVIFTGSGTESNNIALFGTIESRRRKGVAYEDMEIVSTRLEHPSVLEVLRHVEGWGIAIKYAEVDGDGLVIAESLESLITPKTILVTFAYANSEIGTVQHVGKLSRIARASEKKFGSRIYVHTDAAQAPLWLSCELDKLGVDILSLDAGKCCGPKGVGVLAFRHDVSLHSFMFGGSQEGGLRPGTENAALIVGAVEALSIALENYLQRSAKAEQLRDLFIKDLEAVEGIVLNGSRGSRIANNVNISIPGIDSEFAVISLDQQGIACSTKSACGGAKGDGSTVVKAVTNSDERALSTIRFTLGEGTTQLELAQAAQAVRSHTEKMLAFKANLLQNSQK